jgi:hypothetical protein
MTVNYGEVINCWHGVDVQVNARLRNGLMLQRGSNVPLTYVTTYGATWGNPNSIPSGS